MANTETTTGFNRVDVTEGYSVNGVLVIGPTGVPVAASTGIVTGAAGAATLSKITGVITTESLATAASSKSTYTITNTLVTATDVINVNVSTTGTGTLVCGSVKPAAGSFTVELVNVATAAALNAACKIYFNVVKTA